MKKIGIIFSLFLFLGTLFLPKMNVYADDKESKGTIEEYLYELGFMENDIDYVEPVVDSFLSSAINGLNSLISITDYFNSLNVFNKISDSNLNSVYKEDLSGHLIEKYSNNISKNIITNSLFGIDNIDSNSATLYFYGLKDDVTYQTSDNFVLYKVNGDYLSRLSRNVELNNIIYTFDNFYVLDIDWSNIYGELESGTYLISKDISYSTEKKITKGICNVLFNVTSDEKILINGFEAYFYDLEENQDNKNNDFLNNPLFKKLPFQEDLVEKEDSFDFVNPEFNSFFKSLMAELDIEKKEKEKNEREEFMESLKRQQEFVERMNKDARSLDARMGFNFNWKRR